MKLQEDWTLPKLFFAVTYVGETFMGIIVDIISYIKKKSQIAQIVLENHSTEETQRTLHDLPGIDFPIKASLSVNLLSLVDVIIDVPFLIELELFYSSKYYTSYTFLLQILIKAINIPLLVSLSINYNRQCNRRDRQYCNSKEWDYHKQQSELQTREKQQITMVSHT